MKKRGKLLLISYLITILSPILFALTPADACACGMLFAENSKNIKMTGEKGLVIFDKKSQQEQMAVYFEMSGTSENSALIVPTPEKAEIGQVKTEIFSDIELLINPSKEIDNNRIGTAPGDTGVTVLEEKEVGSFQIAELRASSYQDLKTWTEDNSFSLDSRAEKATKTYIDSQFVLNVIKLKKNADESEINPLLFTFKSSKVFYPMMTYEDDTDTSKDKTLRLYILSDSETYVPNAEINNKHVTKSELESSITKTEEKDFSNLNFSNNDYYASKVYTSDYSNEPKLLSLFSDPTGAKPTEQTAQPQTKNKTQNNAWIYVMTISAILMMGLLAITMIEKKKGKK